MTNAVKCNVRPTQVSAATSHLFGSFLAKAESEPDLEVCVQTRAKEKLFKTMFLVFNTNKHNVFRTLSWWTALTWTWTPNEVVVVVSFCCRALILSYCDAKTWPKIPRALNLSSSVIGNSCSQILVFHVPLLFEQTKFYI